jgi:hypothetical protein
MRNAHISEMRSKLQERLLNEGSGQNMKIIQAFKYGCKRSKIFGNIQVSMAIFLSSYIHQGDYLFSVQSRLCFYEFICTFNCPKYTTDRLVKNNIYKECLITIYKETECTCKL